ncbi:1798_t:CDS:2 [Acaulospora morrowiae]|uniref:1798_t:CDS:1 n=1 Tax=Acaulospora morrowiae TaxID=94023 RepID=A0A9N9CQH6_9GLOM|nr:1798_t:CDS:2 [Acaulospora morrowiae]
MYRPSNKTNPLLHLYPPPPHPPPPNDFPSSSSPQQFLRFREFHQKHFVDNSEFFRSVLNPRPLHSQRVYEGLNWNQNDNDRNQPSGRDGYYGEDNEGWIEDEGGYGEGVNDEWNEEEEEKVELVLSDEMIAMFRFSEMRRLKKEGASSEGEDKLPSEKNRPPTPSYATSEPDPSILTSNLTTAEALELYGKSYPTIQTLEATLNDFFQRSCHKKEEESVVYWPVLPMRFI